MLAISISITQLRIKFDIFTQVFIVLKVAKLQRREENVSRRKSAQRRINIISTFIFYTILNSKNVGEHEMFQMKLTTPMLLGGAFNFYSLGIRGTFPQP